MRVLERRHPGALDGRHAYGRQTRHGVRRVREPAAVTTSLRHPRRRDALSLLGALGTLSLAGCCGLRPFATPKIPAELPRGLGLPLRPELPEQGSRASGFYKVDVHSHFFNASDVPVRGFLEGPVAHGLPPTLQALVQLLAPIADELAAIAPTADREYGDLVEALQRAAPRGAAAVESELEGMMVRAQREASRRFFEAVRRDTRGFEIAFNALKREQRAKGLLFEGQSSDLFNESSVFEAMRLSSRPEAKASAMQHSAEAKATYGDGILAFVGFMLSPRWVNLRVYSQAFTTGPEAFGIDCTLGALVDFDRWLDCAPRSAQDDQVRLHQLLSVLSGGYMLPLASYNPWTDIVEGGAATRRVVDAVRDRGFVGAKIYPPNGFRPYGNEAYPPRRMPGGPSARDLDVALKGFWDACVAERIPVMAHTGESMGWDEEFDQLGGPPSWNALVDAFAGSARRPLVNAGHFGGDDATNDWTGKLAELMAKPGGEGVFGDIGYWSKLRCVLDDDDCRSASKRFAAAVVGPAAHRVMYGSDWLMLSREPNWPRYPHEIMKATRGVLPAEDLFGGNAKALFGERLMKAADARSGNAGSPSSSAAAIATAPQRQALACGWNRPSRPEADT